jgi:hypothetical protein
MNSNYQVNRFYAQERVNAQLKAAEVYRQNHKDRAGYRTALTGAATRTYSWLGRVFSRAGQSLESLAQTRVAFFHR